MSLPPLAARQGRTASQKGGYSHGTLLVVGLEPAWDLRIAGGRGQFWLGQLKYLWSDLWNQSENHCLAALSNLWGHL